VSISIDHLLQSFDANTINSIARELGVSPTQATASIEHALPVLLGQMARNAAEPEGAKALLGAVERDHTGIDMGGLLGGLFGGGGAPAPQRPQESGGDVLSQGMAILGHVFGGARQAPQTPKVGGLDGATSGKLMAMLAPLVMAWLGRARQGGGLDLGSLGQVLGGASRGLGGGQSGGGSGALGAILDRNGDGRIGLDEMLGAAQSLGLFGGKR
jgi:hypothetical protein